MNPNCHRTYATFRLIGDSISPDEVTRRLDISPSAGFAKGETRRGLVTMSSITQRTGIWTLSTKLLSNSTSVEDHLRLLIDRLRPVAAEIRSLVQDLNARSDVFCYWASATGHGGPLVPAQILRELGDLGADLGFDFYGPDGCADNNRHE